MGRIVVTGYGVIAPKTKNTYQFLDHLINGRNCLELNDDMGPKQKKVIIGKVEKELQEWESDKKLTRFPKAARMGMVAGEEALAQANLTDLFKKRVGIFWGTSLGSIGEDIFQETIINARKSNYRDVPITFSHYANYHSITSAIAHYLGTKGITKTITTGCTSSLEAIQDAMMYLQAGVIDIAIVGGSDSVIDKIATYGFAKTKSISLDQPMQEGATPFSENSKGLAISEAAGTIILESEEYALQRNACILGEIEGINSNNDGTYLFTVDDTGEQMQKALRAVVKGRYPDYVNSQAVGIKVNDFIEKRCSKDLFNHSVPYTSIKSMYGNPYGATGILQVISALLSIQYGFIPPTIRTDRKGYEEMNLVIEPTFQKINEVAVTNHGYGGNNACAYIKRYKQSGENY